MSEKELTAVEWLVDELYKQGISLYTPELIEQAKEKEKEQIIDIIKLVIEKEYHEQTWAKCGSISYIAEKYYNETFKQ